MAALSDDEGAPLLTEEKKKRFAQVAKPLRSKE
jgi:hypothetical protein